jgi:hypothetical protein
MAYIDVPTLSSTTLCHHASVASLAQQGCVGFWSFAGFAVFAVQLCIAGFAVQLCFAGFAEVNALLPI